MTDQAGVQWSAFRPPFLPTGFTGAPAITVEADGYWYLVRPGYALDHGRPVCEAYPICRWAMPIDGVRELVMNGLTHGISRTSASTFQKVAFLDVRDDGDNSSLFFVARRIRRTIGLEHRRGGMRDPQVAGMIERIKVAGSRLCATFPQDATPTCRSRFVVAAFLIPALSIRAAGPTACRRPTSSKFEFAAPALGAAAAIREAVMEWRMEAAGWPIFAAASAPVGDSCRALDG